MIGETVAHYRVTTKLGEGGMGEVYRARDARLGRDVALKILPDHFANNPDRRARFETEARAASALNHPGIVTIYDIGNTDGVAYLVTEFVDGANLRQSRPEGLRRQLDVAAQIAEALGAAHAAGITHRDLKPENIMTTRDGRVKILDFGLARQSASSPAEETLTAVTTPGMILGTVGYMSPEQARGRAADSRSDVFSLGAVMYELFSGRRAFDGESPADVLSAILKSDPPELPPSVPAGARQIVDRCLDKDPARRFQSTQDLAFALRAVAGSSMTAAASPAIADLPYAKTKWVWWPLAAACSLVLLFAAGFWRLATEPQLPDISRYRLRPFAAEDVAERFPAWSPDGKSIAYVVQRKSNSELTVKSLDGSPAAVLASAGGQYGIFSISWMPDGSKLYYVQTIGPLFGPVLSVARAGGEPQRIVADPVFAAALSPDGSTLAALMREEASGQRQRVLTLSSPPGSVGKRIRTFPGWALQNRIAWSPDGSKIVVWLQGPQFWVVDARSGSGKSFQSPDRAPIWFNFAWLDKRRIIVSWPRRADVDEARTDLWALDTVTGRMTLVFPGTESLTDPTVSPDGSSLAFTNGSGDYDLMELPLDGGPIRQLHATGQWEDSVDWSPVAPEFVYVTQDGIRLRSKDGSRDGLIVTPANFQGRATRFIAPSFSPDGRRIAYIVVDTGQSRSGWISSISGGAPAPLGNFEGLLGSPSWSPDGKWMALGGAQLAKARVGSGEKPIILADHPCGFIPSWSPDGRRILCSAQGVLFTISADGGSPEFLGKEYEPIAVWSRDMRYVYAIRNADGKRQLGKLEWKRGIFQPIVDVPKEWRMNTPAFGAVRLSLSPDGKNLATTVVRQTGEIWILNGFEPTSTLWQRLWRK